MRTTALAGVLLGLCLVPLRAVAGPCPEAIAAAERAVGTAPGLLHAIAMVESGHSDPDTGERQPWPWTINAEGAGSYYPTKEAAIDAARALQGRGVRSMDVGCLQVNLMHHPDAFASLDEAFDPGSNATYAAGFLTSLFVRTGTWSDAAAGYHSLNPERGLPYARQVMAHWTGAAGLPAAALAFLPRPGALMPAIQRIAISMRRTLAEASGATLLDIADVARNPVQVATFQGGATMQVIYVGPATPLQPRRRRF
jgi:hypothetical protein